MSDIDDFDISSILGMSSILNKEETNSGFNLKGIERELLNHRGDLGELDSLEDDDYTNPEEDESTISYDPVKEYNKMLDNLDSLNNESKKDPELNFSSNSISMFEDMSSGVEYTEEKSNQILVDSLFNSNKVIEKNSTSSIYHAEPSSSGEYNDKLYDLSGENADDMKLRLLEKIDNLKYELEEDGINLDRIPLVDFSSPIEEIENVAKLLMLKATRNRYSNMGEEFILAISNGLEILCNGDREFFGLKPDLTNCTDIVKVKLRRVKNETSQIVADVVEKYEIPPLMTVLIELVPALFLHSRRRSMQKSSIISGGIDLSDDINEIRKF